MIEALPHVGQLLGLVAASRFGMIRALHQLSQLCHFTLKVLLCELYFRCVTHLELTELSSEAIKLLHHVFLSKLGLLSLHFLC